MGSAADVTVVGTSAVPAALILDPPGDLAASQAYWESLEGMLVSLPVTGVVVGPTSYGTIMVVPGDEGVDRVMRGSAQQGMVFGVRPDERYGSGAPNLIVGSIVEGVDGPLAYTYGNCTAADQDGYAVLYEQTLPDTTPAWPSAGLDELTLASFNTYNLHSTDTELTKVADTIEAMGAPLIVGLQEIDVDGVMAPLLSDLAGAGHSYEFASSHPDVGGHGVALLWRTDRVTQVDWTTEYQGCSAYGSTSSVAYDDYCESTGLYPLFSRRPVVATATVTLDGYEAQVIVIANHFKSKLGGADADQRRLEQAKFVAALVDQFVAENPDADVVVLGDLNDFEDAPPLEALYASGVMTNTWYSLPAEARYSYIYNGVSQVLDHILLSQHALSRLSEAGPLHTNADYPYLPWANDPSVIWRTSDHEPVAATLRYRPPEAAFAASATEVYVDDVVAFDNQSTGDGPLAYLWDFGDGATSAETSPQHSWADPGIYAVTLVASNDLGSSSASIEIVVKPREVPFSTFTLGMTGIRWGGRDGDRGNLTIEGAFELPKGYSLDVLTGELELAIEIGRQLVSTTVTLATDGPMWRYSQPRTHPDEELFLTQATLKWKDKQAQRIAFAPSGVLEVPGVGYDTEPAEAQITLALPVADEDLAQRVVGSSTVSFDPQGRVWWYKPWIVPPHRHAADS